MKRLKKQGDTLIEVTFALSVFALISVLSLQIMNRDTAMIQGTLEAQMARNEIDAQAEALRFIQNSYLSERELAADKREYQNLWLKLSRGTTEAVGTSKDGHGLANLPTNISAFRSIDCSNYYTNPTESDIKTVFENHAFVVNTRKIDPENVDKTIFQADEDTNKEKFTETQLYPRVLYTQEGGSTDAKQEDDNLSELNSGDSTTYNAQNAKVYDKFSKAEGIWVIAARDYREKNEKKIPEFFDFHIRTCWFAPGRERPSTISTTIRLYNPELVEDTKVTKR